MDATTTQITENPRIATRRRFRPLYTGRLRLPFLTSLQASPEPTQQAGRTYTPRPIQRHSPGVPGRGSRLSNTQVGRLAPRSKYSSKRCPSVVSTW
jgi:hypothetical protein